MDASKKTVNVSGLSSIIIYLFILIPCLFSQAVATVLHPVGSSVPVQILNIDFDVEARGKYVSAMMEVRLVAAYGHENTANMRFPLPKNAVLHKAEIYSPQSQTWMQAETLGRREGEAVFNEISQTNQDPLLLQQIGEDFYRARVYPVTAAGETRIRIYYAHLLDTSANGYLLHIPFARPDAVAASPARGVSVSFSGEHYQIGSWSMGETLLTASDSTTENATSISHIELEDVTLDQDVILSLTPNESVSDVAALLYQSSTNNYLHTNWLPDLSAYQNDVLRPRHVVFVIDVSGSMMGNKIELAIDAVISSLQALDDNDYFGVVTFSNEVSSFRATMQSGTDTGAAESWVSGIQARVGGGTGLSAGLVQAAIVGSDSPVSDASIDLMVITDGLPNIGSSTVEGLLSDLGNQGEQINRNLRIFSVGIGHDLDQTLLNELSSNTGGESTFALDDSEIEGQVLALFERIRDGGFNNVSYQINASDSVESYSQIRLFPGTELNMGIEGVSSSPISLNFNATLPGLDVLNLSSEITLPSPDDSLFHTIAVPLTAKTWADRIERQIDTEAETTALVDEAVRLSRTYGIVTRYSSLLALESNEQYVDFGVDRIERDAAGIALSPITVSSFDEGRLGGSGIIEVANTGNVSMSGGNSFSGSPDATYTCDDFSLDRQDFAYLPRVFFRGAEYWASMKMAQGLSGSVFDLVTYQLSSQPSGSPCPAAILSDDMTLLSIPSAMVPNGDSAITVTNITMLMQADAQTLKFILTNFDAPN